MQSDPLVKVTSTSERFAKMRARKEAAGSAPAPAPAGAPGPTTTSSTTSSASAADPVESDPLSQFQAEMQLEKQESSPTVASEQTAPNSSSASSNNKKKTAPKAPVRLEVTANALAQDFMSSCTKPIGARADQRAFESIEGVMEVARHGAWAHVLSAAPMHLLALRAEEDTGPDARRRQLADGRTLTVLQLVAYVQLGQYMLAADAIREELRCPYIHSVEAAELAGREGRTARNIAALFANKGRVPTQPPQAPQEADAGPPGAKPPDEKSLHNYNVPVAALMIHAELPFGLHNDPETVMQRAQALMQHIEDHAARLEGAADGTVGYSDEELRHIARSTGAVPFFSEEMSEEKLRDAYCALVSGVRSPGGRQPALVPNHYVPVALMDRVQCCAWRLRLLELLVGYSIPARRTALAVKMCQDVYQRTSSFLEYARQAQPLSIFSVALTRIARILTCAGAMHIATPLLEFVNESTPSEGPEANALQLEMAMLHFARRDYSVAMGLYKKVLDECVHNTHDSTHAASFVVDPPGFTGRMIAANNYAICCVHNCCVGDGIKELEQLLQSDPMRFFRKQILFNLCTLYDLAFCKKEALMKKTALKMVGDKYSLSHLQRKHYLLH